jgi:hypothetical protein
MADTRTAVVFVSVVGLKTWEEVTLQYPIQALLTRCDDWTSFR